MKCECWCVPLVKPLYVIKDGQNLYAVGDEGLRPLTSDEWVMWMKFRLWMEEF